MRGFRFVGRRAGLAIGALASAVLLVSINVGPAGASTGRVLSAWGDNFYGELGLGLATSGPSSCGGIGCATTPSAVPGLVGVKSVSGGSGFSLALLKDGTVDSWGTAFNGELGRHLVTQSLSPVAVPGLTKVKAVAAGYEHSLAMFKTGTVDAWGDNQYGELGNGTTINSDVPVAIPGLIGVKSIATGGAFNLALLKNGTVRAWGEGSYGELGNGTTTSSLIPVTVAGLSSVKAIAAGSGHALALMADGTVMAWGYNASGQLGNGATATSLTPVAVSGLSGVVAVSAGSQFSLALLSSGGVVAWGNDDHGQIGQGPGFHFDSTCGTSLCKTTPTPVYGLTGIKTVSAGYDYALALSTTGTVSSWGAGTSGQLGTGSLSDTATPLAIGALVKPKAIFAGQGEQSFAT